MTDGIIIDTSELSALAADLGEAPARAGRNIRSAVGRTAHRIRDDWRDSAQGLPHAPLFPYSISYDLKVFQGFGASVIQAEIGPDKERPQGALGNLIEYGSVNNPPMGLGHGALQKNEDDFERGLTIAVSDAL